MFDRDMRILHRPIKKIVTIHQIAKWTSCQTRPPASMSIGEWQFEPIGCGIRQPLYAVSREVVILSLLPVGDNRRARGLELLDRVPNGFVVKRLQTMMQAAVPFDRIKQFQRARILPIGSVGIVTAQF